MREAKWSGIPNLSMSIYKYWARFKTMSYLSQVFRIRHQEVFSYYRRNRLIPFFKEDIDDPKFFYTIHKVFYAGLLVWGEKGPYLGPCVIGTSVSKYRKWLYTTYLYNKNTLYIHSANIWMSKAQHEYKNMGIQFGGKISLI